MNREQVFQKIQKKIGRMSVSCSCEQCRKMCERTPCMGTPHDILALIDAGYIDQLCYTEWAAGIVLGFTKTTIPMIQIKYYKGACVFYHDGKCDLHESGLKPTEGKLSHHDVTLRELLPQYNLSYQVAKEWNDDNIDVIQEIVQKMNKFLDSETRQP